MSDLQLKHSTPAFRTWCGPDSLAALPLDLARAGAERAVIVCGQSLARQGTELARVEEAIGNRLAGRFDAVEQHSPTHVVEALRDMLARERADSVVAVGGGSAIVTARAATIVLAEDRDIRELCTRRAEDGRMVSPKLRAPKLPQWIVPTTPTTAYAKAGAAVRDPITGERLALYDPKARAQGIVLDASLALTAPAQLALGAAMNAFAMSVEGLASPINDPLAEALLAHSLRMFLTFLPQLRNDPGCGETRLQLMLAALLCGQGSDFHSGGLAQALAHAAGPRSTSANGVIEAMLLPSALGWDLPESGAARVADALLGVRGEVVAPGLIEHAIVDLLDALALPHRLRDTGVSADSLAEIAAHAADDWAISNLRRSMGPSDLLGLLKQTW